MHFLVTEVFKECLILIQYYSSAAISLEDDSQKVAGGALTLRLTQLVVGMAQRFKESGHVFFVGVLLGEEEWLLSVRHDHEVAMLKAG